MRRRFRTSLVLAPLLVPLGCSYVTGIDETDAEGPEAGGGAAAEPPELEPPSEEESEEEPVEAPWIEDSGTLSVHVDIAAYAPSGESDAEVQVSISVEVREWETDRPVMDAVVTVGPAGRPSVLPYNVYSEALYFGELTGYAPVWEVAVERGVDRLAGLVLVGPSYHEVAASPSAGSATVTWSPSSEDGVRAVACLESECVDVAQDGGSVVLPIQSREDAVFVARSTKVPVGLGGDGVVSVAVLTDLP